MVFGWMLYTGTDTRGRKLLHIKKTEKYYLLPENREFAVTLWKHNEINAISISIILGYFVFHSIPASILIGCIVYVAVCWYMNQKFLTSLSKVGGKKITWRKEVVRRENSVLPALLFLLVGIGLWLCIAFDQTQNTAETIAAAVGGTVSLGLAIRQYYMTRRK